jgi:hypothetical protein
MSSTASATSSGGALAFVTVEFPELPTSQLNKAGINIFLDKYSEYTRRISSIPGANPRPLQDALARDVLDLWLSRKMIKDRSDDEIMHQLESLVKKIKVNEKTVEEVFSGKNVENLYRPDFTPEARLVELNAKVGKLISENALEKQLEDKKIKKKLQGKIAGIITIPKAEERIKRRMELNGGPFDDTAFDELLLYLFLEHEEYQLCAKQKDQVREGKSWEKIKIHENRFKDNKNQENKSKENKNQEQSAKPVRRVNEQGLLVTQTGKVLQCLVCQGNHFAAECPKASLEQKKQSEVLSASKGHRPVTRSVTAAAGTGTSTATSTTVNQSVKKTLAITAIQELGKENQVKELHGEEVDARVGAYRFAAKVLLDSGSGADLISAQLLRKAEDAADIKASAVRVVQADGTSVKVEGQTEIRIEFSTGAIRLPILVVDAKADLLILSNNTLREYGVKIGESFLQGLAQFSHEDNSMEDVLAPSLLIEKEPTTKVQIPEIEALFPDIETFSEAEKILIKEFYAKLETLLYGGIDPIKHPPMDVPLREGAIPQHYRARMVTPEVRKALEEIERTLLEKKWIKLAPGPTEWASMLFAVRKPDGSARPVCDYVATNTQLRPVHNPMPFLDSENDLLQNSVVFGLLDCEKGYHQVELTPEAQRVLAIQILGKVYLPQRLFPGISCATAHFQALMTKIVNQPGTRVWLDDTLLHGESVEKYLELLENVLCSLRDHNVRLNLRKCTLMARKVTFCGKQYSEMGIRYDPDRVKTLLDTPIPSKGADLVAFLNSCNWNRDSLPRYSEVTAPLYDLLEKLYQGAGVRTKQALQRVHLSTLWQEEHKIAFHALKQLLAGEILRDFPRDSWDLYLFTDASESHWSGVLMQAPPLEQAQEIPLKDRKFRILSFVSGAFKKAALRWDTQSKESYAILASLNKVKALLVSCVNIVTDHANLKWILQTSEPSLKKATQSRILRMRETLGQYEYKIHWIAGSVIPFVDFYSRAGVKIDEESVGLRGGFALEKGEGEEGEEIKQVSALYISSASSDDFEYPVSEEFFKVDNELMQKEFGALENIKPRDDGHWEWKGKIYPPNAQVRHKLLMATHSGIGGHVSLPKMMMLLRAHYEWPGMAREAMRFVEGCAHCITSRDGNVEKRPFGEILRGVRPNQMIQFDHLYMEGKAQAKHTQLLVVVDSFSDFTVLFPSKGTTAAETAEHLSKYISLFGVPEYIASDSGAGFLSETIKGMLKRLKVEHHVVTPYHHTGLSLAEN